MSPSWVRKTDDGCHPRSKSTVDRAIWGAGEIQLSFQWLCEQAWWVGIRSRKCRASAQHPPILPHRIFTKCMGSQWLGWKAERFIASKGWDSPVHLEGEVCSNPQESKTNHELALMSPAHQAQPSSPPDDIRDQLFRLGIWHRLEPGHPRGMYFLLWSLCSCIQYV